MKKMKTFFEAVVVVTVVLALVLPSSAIITNTSIEKITSNMFFKEIEESISIGGPIKVKAQQVPLSFGEGFPSKTSRGTDVQVTSGTEFEGNPAIAIDSDGTMFITYELEEDILERTINMMTSKDGGKTWINEGYWDLPGTIDELSSLDYAGLVDGMQNFHGTFLCSENDYGDGYHIEIKDVNNPSDETWLLWTTTWSDNGFFDFSSCDIVAYDQTIGASTDYFVMSLVGSFEGIPGYPDCYQVPFYQITKADSSSIYWFYYNYSANGRMDIDKSAEIIYYAFEWDNSGNQDVILLSSELQYVGEVEPGGWGDGMGEGRKYQVEGSANTINPAIAAEDNYVYLIVQTDQTGNQDLVCYYSSDGGDTYDMSVIANSNADETNPAVYASGKDAVCIFTKDNNIYIAVTEDGGQNWIIDDDPVNDFTSSIVEQYKCVDIFGVSTVWTDSRDNDGDVYYDSFSNPPGAPTITGPSTGKAGEELSFIFNSVDPDVDQVKYIIDWNDTTSNTTDFYPSGQDVTVKHTWGIKGTYTIKAKAQDSNGLIGPVAEKTITIQKSKTLNLPCFKFLQNYPNLLPILKYLLGL